MGPRALITFLINSFICALNLRSLDIVMSRLYPSCSLRSSGTHFSIKCHVAAPFAVGLSVASFARWWPWSVRLPNRACSAPPGQVRAETSAGSSGHSPDLMKLPWLYVGPCGSREQRWRLSKAAARPSWKRLPEIRSQDITGCVSL